MQRELTSTQNRMGITTTEIVVALVLLSVCVTAVGQFVGYSRRALDQNELNTRIGWELTSARETIGSWEPSQINVETIRSLPISDAISRVLINPQWQAELHPVNSPFPATRITLSLTGTIKDQLATPAELTFWVAANSNEADS